jgi:hypothetical protein
MWFWDDENKQRLLSVSGCVNSSSTGMEGTEVSAIAEDSEELQRRCCGATALRA